MMLLQWRPWAVNLVSFCFLEHHLDWSFKKIRCKKNLKWAPAKYWNTCDPVAPDGDTCPMPSRVGNSVTTLDSWEDDTKDKKYGGGWISEVSIRPMTDQLINSFSVVLVFDSPIFEYQFTASTMRVSKQLKKSLTLVNEVYNSNMTGVDQFRNVFIWTFRLIQFWLELLFIWPMRSRILIGSFWN